MSLWSSLAALPQVETIGDAYMVCSNLTQLSDTHVDDIINYAIRMQQVAW